MKSKRRTAAVLLLALGLCQCRTLAAVPDGATAETAMPVPSTVYPAEVRASEENGVHRLEKVYYLSTGDDPAAIPTEDFEREGRVYTLLDVLKNDQSETDTKDHIEVITLNAGTKDMAEIIKLLEPELEVSTEDGYTGVLTPDYPSITVEAAGYKTSSWTVSATRTYPNLSDADVSLIPKTITDGGRTLTLANVDWQDAAADHTDGYDLPIRYTAVASYTGAATGKYATGYTVTVDYTGEVTKTSCDAVIYTAVFSSHDETQFEAAPESEPAPLEPIETETEEIKDAAENEVAAEDEKEGMDKRLLLIPAGILLLAGAGYGGWRGIKYYKDKKRGYIR